MILQSRKNKLILFFILATSAFFGTKSEKITHQSGKQNWNAFNNAFIKPSQLEAKSASNRAIKLFGSLALGTTFWITLSSCFGAILSYRLVVVQTAANPDGDWSYQDGFFYNKFGLFLTAMPSLYFTRNAFRRMHEWVLAREEQKALKAYIENWEVNQKNTPKKLHNLLSQTHKKYRENPAQADFAETARIVKAFVSNQKFKDNKNSKKQA